MICGQLENCTLTFVCPLVLKDKLGGLHHSLVTNCLKGRWRNRRMAFFNPKSLLMLDSCGAHITPEIKTVVNKYSKMAVIPGGLTKKLQPLDIAVNKPFKESDGEFLGFE